MKKWFPVLTACAAMCLFGCSKTQTTESVEAPTGDQVEAPESSDAQPETVANPDETAAKAEKGDLQEGTLPQEAVPVDEALVAQWVVANNDFGLKMLRNIELKESVVVSPFSAERALGMTLDGAVGATEAELRTALSLPEAANLSAAGAEIEKIVVKNDNPDVYSIHVDNRVWINGGLKLLDAYSNSIKTNYLAEPRTLNFSGDPEGSRKTINDDIAKSTENKILDLIKPRMITPLTRSVLTSAIYFKSPWRHTFDKNSTAKETFYTVGGSVQVDMMHHTKSHPYMHNDELTAFELDFAGNYSLLVAMPNLQDNGKSIEALVTREKNMTGAKIVDMHKAMRNESRSELRLSMPKYRIEYDDSLKSMLESFGVKTAFDGSKADFSRMTTDTDLYISEVVQKAFIDVNEEGAEAAAATAVIMNTRAMMPRQGDPIVVKVDHPFMYALIENSTGTALFMGHYIGK